MAGSSAPGFPLGVLSSRRLGEHIQQFQERSGLGLSLGPSPVAFPKEGWLEQPLDPFNASDRRFFLQRYWVNDQHRASQDGPVFLHLGGEGSLGPGSVMRGHPATLAPVWGALVISLEHRFYGLSIPAGGLDMAQLRFLSSRHALADVISARLTLSRLFNVSSSSPWICFGGSYAGSLAAWARLKFPHLIFASVASSAPVRAVLDFSEYNNCRAAASAAFAEVKRRLRAGGAAQAALRAELGACGSLGRSEDQAELLGTLQALVGGAVQYDGQLPALPSQLDLCEQVFGLSTSSIAKAVAQTNSYYGGQTPGATQVLFVNGDTDPWHVLSVTQALGPSEAALLIPNASHCLDMAPERPSDPPSLLLARQNIFQQLQTWLQLAKESQVRSGV
ncbi:Thymus-specific serine protease [Camelus dromedarius]|uniref:Thymus-specific serine protease n=1 Tax=Camelus dromedarius TaxID=9838 RepID=A0A5N4CQJ6_CAMDR|nr:Thymus-specific serine protease [Camelus dromedarius]